MILLLRLAIAVFMGLTLFSLMMMVLNKSAFGVRLIESEPTSVDAEPSLPCRHSKERKGQWQI
jgi:hypothetical protein